MARIKFNLVSKFNQMLNDWAGRTATKITVVETIDEQGNVIDRTETETEITALIGNPSTDISNQPAGTFHPGDLCMYSKIADDVQDFSQLMPTTTRHDLVRYEGATYRPKLTDTIYDVDIESIRVFKLKKVAI